jgi:hypothetical protein
VMSRYIHFFITQAFLNFIFVGLYTSIYGTEINLSSFLISGWAYVLPFTVINFVVIGIASTYLIVKTRRSGFFDVISLVGLAICDCFLAVHFFNNSDWYVVGIRLATYVGCLIVFLSTKDLFENKKKT